MKNDIINLVKIGIITVASMIGKWSYGDTFSYSNQEVLHSKNDSVSSIEKTRDGVIQVALYKREDSSFCILNPNHYQSEIKNPKIIKFAEESTLICSPFDEDDIIQGFGAQNADSIKQGIGIIAKDGDSYLTVSVETVPVSLFEPVMWHIPLIVGGGMIVSRIPPSTWMKITGSAVVLIEVVRQLAMNKDIFFSQPKGRTMDRYSPDGTYLQGIEDDENERLLFPPETNEDDIDDILGWIPTQDEGQLVVSFDEWRAADQDVMFLIEGGLIEATLDVIEEQLRDMNDEPEVGNLVAQAMGRALSDIVFLKQVYKSWEEGQGEISEEELALNPELEKLLKLGEVLKLYDHLDESSLEDRQNLEEFHKLWTKIWYQNHRQISLRYNTVLKEWKNRSTEKEGLQIKEKFLLDILKILG